MWESDAVSEKELKWRGEIGFKEKIIHLYINDCLIIVIMMSGNIMAEETAAEYKHDLTE